jgi:alpha-1,2-mannosyltransferase
MAGDGSLSILRIGASLSRSVSLNTTRGLRRSREGLVKISPAEAALALLVGAALLVLYGRRALSGYDGGPLPYDLVVFLDAADDVLAGRNPFPPPDALSGDANYVYPPLLALALVPLALLPVAPAVVLWTALGVAAVCAALWLLGVRDWRVYAVALAFPATRDAIGAGTVGPLLLLGAALAWRYRDARPAAAGLSAGLTAALKLFTWPLLVWLAASGRVRAAAIGVVGAGAAVLASWLVIGFAGLADYPGLVRRLTELEADKSYSLVAVAAAAGVPEAVGFAFSLAAGAALLALAVSAGRTRERDALTATIAAALVLTPIVWIHYLILLLVPLALARPRLSPLWLALLLPLVPRVWGWQPAGWPEGDPASLAVVLGVAALVLVGTARARRA